MRDLPRVVATCALAFADYEPRPMLAVMQLVRGLSIQAAYRWGTGQVRTDGRGRAALLWSTPGRRAGWRRELTGIAVAVVVGLVLFALSNLLLLLPLRFGLDTAGVTSGTRAWVLLLVPMGRLAVTAVRSGQAYRVERARTRCLPQVRGACWRVDYLAALPQGQGAGGQLLAAFLAEADDARAVVVLTCEPELVAFYNRFGFRLHQGAGTAALGCALMLRRPYAAGTDARRRPAADTRRAAGPVLTPGRRGGAVKLSGARSL